VELGGSRGERNPPPSPLFDASAYPTTCAGEVKGFESTNFNPQKKVKEFWRTRSSPSRPGNLGLQMPASSGRNRRHPQPIRDRDKCVTVHRRRMGGPRGNLPALADPRGRRDRSRISPVLHPHVIANLAAGKVAIGVRLKVPTIATTSLGGL